MKILKYLAAGAVVMMLGACSSNKEKSEVKDSTADSTEVVGFIEEMPSSDSTGVISTGDGVAVENN
ncbi:MAG: hypothetical protein K2G69_05680 [Muribaculaceae bacterium]|nr:hypothetical protein [Muribaculaceae bacterium]